MAMKKIPFARPCFSDEDIRQIFLRLEEVLRSGWLTNAKYVAELEKKVSEYVGARYAVAMNSCTACLHALMWALRIKPGDEVIVPANTFVSTANAPLYVGAKPVFVDVDLDTYNILPEDVQEKISSRTKAIIAVHVGGNPADMSELIEIAEDHNLIVIEDAAHALGSIYKGKYCGNIGFAGAFSLYPTKVITGGEGGIIVTDNRELYDRLKLIRNCGRASIGAVDIVELGHNFRMTECSAVFAIVQFSHIEEFIKHRNDIAGMYTKELRKFKWIKIQKIRPGNRSAYYAYIILLDRNAPIGRDELRLKLRERGIDTSIIYKPVHLQPLYRRLFKYNRGMLPNAEFIGANNIALPMYNGLSFDEVHYIIQVLRDIFEGL